MTQPSAQTGPKPTGSFYMIFLLSIVSTFCGVVIVGAYLATDAAIKKNLATITRESVQKIVPDAQKQVIFGLEPSGSLKKLESAEGNLPKLYATYDDAGKLISVVCEGSARGYGDLIKALYAYSPEKQAVTGFTVLEMRETPGLGDKIVGDPDFLSNFTELSVKLDSSGTKLEHAIEAVKHGSKSSPWQVDGITGATISSKAVAKLLNESANATLPTVVRNLEQLKKGE